jgi:hypothetical protein
MIFKRYSCKIGEEKKRKKKNNDRDGSDRNDNSNNGQHEHRSSKKRRTVLVSNEIRYVIIGFAVVAITLFGLRLALHVENPLYVISSGSMVSPLSRRSHQIYKSCSQILAPVI